MAERRLQLAIVKEAWFGVMGGHATLSVMVHNTDGECLVVLGINDAVKFIELNEIADISHLVGKPVVVDASTHEWKLERLFLTEDSYGSEY